VTLPSAGELLPLTVSDLRQQVYCPRIPYFRLGLRLPHRFITGAMQEGIIEHQRTSDLEQRRTLRAYGIEDGVRYFDVQMHAPQVALSGRVDMVILRQREAIPVEFKNSQAGIGVNHRCQLAAYAMLAEGHFGKPVRRAFVYFIPLKQALPQEITPAMRAYARRALHAIRAAVGMERMPDGTRVLGRCRVCEFLPYCNDRW